MVWQCCLRKDKGFYSYNKCSQDNKAVKYDPKFIPEAFEVFFTYMAKTLLQKLPPPQSKHGIDSISKFHKDLDITRNPNWN